MISVLTAAKASSMSFMQQISASKKDPPKNFVVESETSEGVENRILEEISSLPF